MISLLNSRAVTVYLWHSFALVLTEPLIDPLWSNSFFYDHLQWLLASQWTPLVIAVPLICLAILLFGWIEDVAARRRPRLFPYSRRAKGRRRGR